MVQFIFIHVSMQTITTSFNMSRKISPNVEYLQRNKLNLRNKANKNYSSRFHKSATLISLKKKLAV